MRLRPLDTPAARRRGRAYGLGSVGESLGRSPARRSPARELLALGAAGGERLLGSLAAVGDCRELPLEALALGARRAPPSPARPRPRATGRAARRARAPSAARASGARGAACSSAASAWRLSGRSRERASRSTSRARSRLSRVRSSLSWARRRRLRCLPSPAASSISSRRSRGLEVTIASTRPWEMTECISLPRPVSDSTSITSISRQRAPASRYSPSPVRSRADARSRSPARRARACRRSRRARARPRPLRRLAAGRAAEDHVLHRLTADRDRRLLAERPQHRVGDVGLAGAVGSDDHADAGAELEPGAVGERLEALERERFQIHAVSPTVRAPPAPPARRPARRPSCCGRCRGRSRSPPIGALIVNVRSCGGPCSSITS